LTRDGFAIAIHLIQKKLAGQDVPSKLPPSLIPPSARVSALGTSPFSPANAESHQEPEPTTDLFLFDDAPPYSPLSQQPPNIFGDGSDLSALLVEKTEIEGALLRDKEEARELHKRMIEMDKHVEALKADVEKEAKQQKGLLAIVRKQLSTKESEKVKAEREHAEAVEELSSITGEKDTVDAELAIMTSLEPKVAQRTLSSDSLASQPIPMTPDNGPDLLALPPVKSNNPFERLAMSSLLLRRSPSPSIQGSKLPGSDLLPVAASSTFNSFSAVQTPANPKSSQPSGETMGKMPASVTPVNFSFDPGFDDGFDFASESASKTLEIEIQDLNKTTQQVEFDDTGPSTPFYLPPPYKDRTSRTFDSVFASAGFGSSPVLKVEDKPIIDSPPVLSRSDEPSISGFFPQPPSLTPVRYPQFRSSSVLYRSDEPQASMSGFLPQPPSLTPGRYPQFRSSSVLYRSDEPSISGSFPEPPSLTSGRYPQFRSSSVLSRSDEPSMSGFFPEPRSLTQSPQRRSSSVLYRSDEPSTSRFFPEPRSLTQSPQRRSSSVLYRSDEPSTSGFFSQPPSLRSPQPRSSSSSTSKDIHDKPKEPLAHHSKLGVRPI
jgi:hypothetical protein